MIVYDERLLTGGYPVGDVRLMVCPCCLNLFVGKIGEYHPLCSERAEAKALAGLSMDRLTDEMNSRRAFGDSAGASRYEQQVQRLKAAMSGGPTEFPVDGPMLLILDTISNYILAVTGGSLSAASVMKERTGPLTVAVLDVIDAEILAKQNESPSPLL